MIESERLEKDYAHYFDSRIVNTDFSETFKTLIRLGFAISSLSDYRSGNVKGTQFRNEPIHPLALRKS